jgi:hypothetical protein
MTFKALQLKIRRWRVANLSETNTVLMLSIFVGSIAAMAAYCVEKYGAFHTPIPSTGFS